MSNLILEIEAPDLADIDLLQCLRYRTVTVEAYFNGAPRTYHSAVVTKVDDEGLLIDKELNCRQGEHRYELVRWEGITKVIYH